MAMLAISVNRVKSHNGVSGVKNHVIIIKKNVKNSGMNIPVFDILIVVKGICLFYD